MKVAVAEQAPVPQSEGQRFFESVFGSDSGSYLDYLPDHQLPAVADLIDAVDAVFTQPEAPASSFDDAADLLKQLEPTVDTPEQPTIPAQDVAFERTPTRRRVGKKIGKAIGVVALSAGLFAGALFGSTAATSAWRGMSATEASAEQPKAETKQTAPRRVPFVRPTRIIDNTTTTEAPEPPYRPEIGQVSAVLTFSANMCNEEVVVREAAPEFGVGADETLLNILELDPTPQQGCEAGTQHVNDARAQGGKNRTREDPARFSVSDPGALPRLADGSLPTNYGQLMPAAERSTASNMFGENGVVYVDGHRSTNSAPFALLDNNKPGDLIFAKRGDGKLATYVTERTVSVPVGSYQQDILAVINEIKSKAGHENIMVISACDPYASKSHRIVSFSVLQAT